MSKNVLVIGSINADYVIQTDRVPVMGETLTGKGFSVNFGGKGANQAVAIAKLGSTVKMLGAVGNDYMGELCIKNLESFGIDCSAVLKTDLSTGAAVITVCEGDNCIIVDEGANRAVTPEVILENESLFEWADVLVMQYEIPLESIPVAARLAKAHGVYTILNPAPAKKTDDSFYPDIDCVIPNEFEAKCITGIYPADDESAASVIRNLQAKGFRRALVTLGKRGSAYSDGDGIKYFGVYPVKAVDSTAAGDSFIGGLCSKLCEGKTLDEAVAYASAVSAIVVSRPGASASIPTTLEVEEFLRSHTAKKG